MVTHDLFEPTPQQLRRAEQALDDARNRRARQDCPMPVARKSDPATSHQAATNAISRSAALRMTALKILAGRDATDFELAKMTGTQQTSIGVRRHELVKMGYARVSRDGLNRIRTRPAPSGSPSMVWEATEAGREYLRSTERT